MGETNNTLTLLRDIGLPVLAGIASAADRDLGRGIQVGAGIASQLSEGRARRRAEAAEAEKTAPARHGRRLVRDVLSQPEIIRVPGPANEGEGPPTQDISGLPNIQAKRLTTLAGTPEGRALLQLAGGNFANITPTEFQRQATITSQDLQQQAQEERERSAGVTEARQAREEKRAESREARAAQKAQREEAQSEERLQQGRARLRLQEGQLRLGQRRFRFDVQKETEKRRAPDFDIRHSTGLNSAGDRMNFLVITDKRTGDFRQLELSPNPKEQTGLIKLIQDKNRGIAGADKDLDEYLKAYGTLGEMREGNKVMRFDPETGSFEMIEGAGAFDQVTQRQNLEKLQNVASAFTAADFVFNRLTPETFGLVARGKALTQQIKDVFGDAFAADHTDEFNAIKESLKDNTLFENSKSARVWRNAFNASRVEQLDSVMLLLAYKIARSVDKGRLSDQDFNKAAEIIGYRKVSARTALSRLQGIRDFLRKEASGYGLLSGRPIEELRGFFPTLFPVPPGPGEPKSVVPPPTGALTPTAPPVQQSMNQEQGSNEVFRQLQEQLNQ